MTVFMNITRIYVLNLVIKNMLLKSCLTSKMQPLFYKKPFLILLST